MADINRKNAASTTKVVGADLDGVEGDFLKVNERGRVLASTQVSDGPQVDSFGRPRTSSLNVFYSEHFSDSAHTLEWPQRLASGGALTHDVDTASRVLSVTTADGSESTTQSSRYFQYIPGQSMAILATGVFAAPKTNVEQVIGFGDDDDGLFFKVDGTTINVGIKSSTSGSSVETLVPQSSWNLDALDGSGPSGLNVNFTKGQIYIIDFEWLGFGRIRYGLILEGIIVYCHEITNLNALDVAYMQRGSLPVRYSIKNTGVTSSSTQLRQGCVSIWGEGVATIGKIATGVSNGVTEVSVSSSGFSYPISMRLNSSFTKSELIVKNISLFTSSNTDIFFEVLVNATITGGTWTPQPNSIIDLNTTATSTSGGRVIAAGYLNSNLSGNIGQATAQFRIGYDTLNNIPGNLVIRARALSANGSVACAVVVTEIY